jgi:rRNA small subunit pseudouridine methyltransferase Nep1
MAGAISLVIAEAALETVPESIVTHPSVRNHASNLGRNPLEIMLDRSYHHAAMERLGLKSGWKRGRPDIIHVALIAAMSTPLFLKNLVRIYVSTVKDKAIFFGENLRIPKSYFRFEGLMMDLFREKVIRNSQNNATLIQLQDNVTFGYLVKNVIKPTKLIGLTKIGIQSTAEKVVSSHLSKNSDHCAFVIGGFPRGHFSQEISSLFDYSYSIGKFSLESHVVIARILYECEKTYSLY